MVDDEGQRHEHDFCIARWNKDDPIAKLLGVPAWQTTLRLFCACGAELGAPSSTESTEEKS